MSTTPPEQDPGHPRHPGDHGHGGPRVTAEELRDLSRIRRSSTDSRVAGVAGGLARHLDVDPVILRVAFVVLIFFGGAGLLLYGACWLLLPTDDGSDAPISLDERTRAVALIAAGVLAAALLLGDTLGDSAFPWPLAVVAVIGLLIYSKRSSHERSVPPAGATTTGTTTGTTTRTAAVPTDYGPTGYGPTDYGPTDDYASYTYAAGYRPDHPGYPDYGPGHRPRNPRKRGPLLFWFTMALCAIGVGALTILANSGVAVPASAYPAAVLVACAVMLTVGAFYGRGGGLILIGLVAALATAFTTFTEVADFERVRLSPATASEVTDHDMGAGGEVVLDLTDVSDLDELDGRTVELDGGIGRMEVILPDEGLDVQADLMIEGPGEFWLFEQSMDGVGLTATGSHDGGEDVPELTIDAGLGVGQLQIHTESQDRPDPRSENEMEGAR